MDEIHHPALDQLRFTQRRTDAQDRLVGEEHRALRQRIDIAGKTKIGERGDKLAREAPAAVEPSQIVGVKAQFRQVIEHLRKSSGDEEVAARRQLAHEKLEYRSSVHPLLKIGLEHRQFVQIGEQNTGNQAISLPLRN